MAKPKLPKPPKPKSARSPATKGRIPGASLPGMPQMPGFLANLKRPTGKK
jgi:hypothetical protein